MTSVLRYSPKGANQSTVRRHYEKWRKDQGIPLRCDIEHCQFHTAELKWNDKPLHLTLDHINGFHADNRVENLRLLCPNCDSQLPTRGGGNIGLLEKATGESFILRSKDRTKRFITVLPPGAVVRLSGSARVEFISGKNRSNG